MAQARYHLAIMDDKLNKQHWLDAGLQALAGGGPERLRIMPIAQQLGVTKGSFYWHFKHLDEYHLALLAEWELCHTQDIITYVDSVAGSASDKLRALMTVTVGADARLAQAIRRWASAYPPAHDAQERVDQQRLRYLEGLLTGMGWPIPDAQTLARWMYCALIGRFSLAGPPISAAQVELVLGVVTPQAVPN